MRPITPHDRDILVPLLRQAHRHNCNYSFANLCSWQRLFASEYEVVDGALVVRFNLFGRRAYLLAADPTEHPLTSVIDWMKSDAQASDSSLMIIAVEEDMAQRLVSLYGEHVAFTAIRDRYDYIYRRDDLMSLAGKDYHGKRNHANKFRSLYPDYRYQPVALRPMPRTHPALGQSTQRRLRERGGRTTIDKLCLRPLGANRHHRRSPLCRRPHGGLHLWRSHLPHTL